MSYLSRLRLFYLLHLSKPSGDRRLYRAIHRQKVRKILELGIGGGQRAKRMIAVAGHATALREIRYIGMDLFESRAAADGPAVTLKAAHRLLTNSGARIRLIPGDPFHALAQTSNSLGQCDLVVISAGLPPESLAKAWFYLPRLLRADSQVVLESTLSDGKTSLRLVDHGEVKHLASAVAMRRAA